MKIRSFFRTVVRWTHLRGFENLGGVKNFNSVNGRTLIRIFFHTRKRTLITSALFLSLVWYWFFSLPRQLFESPRSLILLSREGDLLGAKVADDGQWRFPTQTAPPEKFKTAIIAFEDKRFYSHIGVDALSLGRAVYQNVSRQEKVSGASTLSMQVIRLSRSGKSRTVFEKMIEIVLATRLELRYSKEEILAMYAANAPFGGNVVGLDAASWRYYGKPADKLSWGEAAALAVLPNSPALVHPGRNRKTLLNKRNRLLKKLEALGKIDKTTGLLARAEPLPDKPFKLPSYSPQLLTRAYFASKKDPEKNMLVHTTVDHALQQRVNRIVERNYAVLSGNGVHNAAAIVLDVRTGNVLAYTGNAIGEGKPEHNWQVDNIRAPRSTGSILKPFLYASMLQDGNILPGMLVPDVPMYINSFTPKNFNFEYNGAVPANQALARSLNIPSVNMLRDYTPDRFSDQLRRMGLSTISKPGSYYGLTLILGGAEANLWELSGTYASMARTLLRYNETSGKYLASDFRAPNTNKEKTVHFPNGGNLQPNPPVLGAASIWLTFQAMLDVSRPEEEKYWGEYGSSKKVAWKTGTSFGNRDAWAIGVSPEFVVAVWAGNSSGEGRAGLTGLNSAAPILFDIFNVLPRKAGWFKKPEGDMRKVNVCRQSGHLPSEYCSDLHEVWIPEAGINSRPCPYHRIVNLDGGGKYRVTSNCEYVSNMQRKPWFVLPPVQESYYKLRHPEYAELPPYRQDCASLDDLANTMSLVYPQDPTQIYLPVNLDGSLSSTVFEAKHRDASAVIYWHIDETYLGSTQAGSHRMALSPEEGKHKLTLVDGDGRKLMQSFEILRKDSEQVAMSNKQ